MTTYTQAQLATRVLLDLGLIGAEETPSAIDLAHVEQTIVSEFALLQAKGISIWNGDDSTIPQEYLTVLSRRIGLAVGPSFGLSDIANATVAMDLLEKDLRRIGSTGPTGGVLETEDF